MRDDAAAALQAGASLAPPDPRLLFIHPHNHLISGAVPIGAVGAANLLPRPPVGRFAAEVSTADIEQARVVLLGVHWFFPIGVLDHMLAAIRQRNPEARIVVGGLTSSFYKEHFAARFPVDYVCTGDVEISFPPLIAALLAGATPPPLPNIVPRGGVAPAATRRLGQEEFDRIDWLRIDWFPSYRRAVVAQHADRRNDLLDGVFPSLPLTRGCVRPCEFCFGAYQRRVFGPRVLLRSPARVVRDLRAIAADPELRFVTLMFAESCYLRHFADALDGLRLPLDAYLMFCGNADPAVLDQVRSAFAGHVSLLTIPPEELAPLRRDRRGPEATAEYARLIEHFRQMTDTRTLVYYVTKRTRVEGLARSDDRVTFASGEDWPIARPTLAELGPERDFSRQLDDLVAVARQTAALHLLRAVVPGVRKTLNPELDTATFLSPDFTRGADPFAVRLHRMLLAHVREQRAVGFAELRLRWFASRSLGGLGAAWAPAGTMLEGDCRWQPTLNGYAWEGQAEIPAALAGRALWVVPVPLVHAANTTVGLEQWLHAQLPGAAVAAGPARTVAVGGEARGEEVALWVADGRQTQRWTLPPPVVAPTFSQRRFPVPDLALALLGVLLRRPALREIGWQLEDFALSPAQLSVAISSPSHVAGIAVFPRDGHGECPGTRAIGCRLFGGGGGDLRRDEAVERLQRTLVELVAGVERSLGGAAPLASPLAGP